MSSALSHGISGLIASCYATTCTYPLDIARTRLQVQTKDEREYSGMLDVIFKVLKNEGLGGLYAGLSSQYIMTSSTNFLYYFFYNYLQTAYNKWLERKAKTNTNNNNNNNNEKRENKPKAGVFATLAIGVLAGCITQFIINPLSVAITRIKGKKPPLGHNIIKTIYLIGIQEGMGALYSGLNASLILTINPSIEFLIFDKLTKYYMMFFNKKPDQISVMILGAISKIFATLVTYPYTMAKSRLQSSSNLRISTMQILSKIMSEEGFFALYIGLQAQLLKSALFSAFRSQGKEKITAVVSSIIK